MDAEEIERLAMEELVGAAARGKQLSKTIGIDAWQGVRRPRANRTYLHNTLLGAMQNNKRISDKTNDQNPTSNTSKIDTKRSHRNKSGASTSRQKSDEKSSNDSRKRARGASKLFSSAMAEIKKKKQEGGK